MLNTKQMKTQLFNMCENLIVNINKIYQEILATLSFDFYY